VDRRECAVRLESLSSLWAAGAGKEEDVASIYAKKRAELLVMPGVAFGSCLKHVTCNSLHERWPQGRRNAFA